MKPALEHDYNISGQDNDGQTRLSRAAEAGEENVVDTLLVDQAVDVNIRDHKGRTPLLLAAEGGHSNVVAQLLGRGANPNLEDLSGSTPLWEAANKGHTTVVGQLIYCDRMFNWNAKKVTYRISDGATALSIALDGLQHNPDLTERLHDVAMMLLKVDALDPFVPRERGDALELAIEYKNEDAALILLDRFGTGQRGSDLLITAIRSGNTRLVEALLTEHGVDPNDPGKHGLRPLTVAIQRDQAAAVGLLLAHDRIQPCMDDILIYLNFHQSSELVRLLVADDRFNMHYVNDKGQTFLSEAAEWGQTAHVEELLRDDQINPDCPDYEGRTPLSHAADGFWNATIVRQLLGTGRVDPNSVDDDGMTPLCHAVSRGHLHVVEALLEHPDTDPNGRGKHVPLILVFDYFREETINLLLAHPKIDPNRVDARGQTALAAAVRRPHTDMVERLLAVPGANPGHKDAAGVTLYHEAARQKSHNKAVRLMELLVGATNRGNPDIEDAKGRTPLSLAAEYGNGDVVDMLLAVDGVRSDREDATGRRPLSWAIASTIGGSDIINERLDAVRHLLSREEVDPNAKDAEGVTPLMHAVLRHGCSGSMVQLLVARDDLDVHQRDQNGCTAMTVAKAYGDTMSMTLLRSRGSVDDSKTAFGVLAGNATEDINVTRKSRDVFNRDHHRWMDWDDYRDGKNSLLPLGKQDAYGDVDDGDADLCDRCKTLDLDSLFSKAGSSADLGCVDASWDSRPCCMCQLIAAARPGHRDGRAADDSESCVLKAFGTTWFGTPTSDWSENWIDTKVLAVVHQKDSKHYADVGFDQHISIHDKTRPHIFEAATIGRLGSNCPYGTQAFTISPYAARLFVDLDLAKNWIADCREHHTSEPCTQHQLHAIPHFRLIECTTGKIMTLEQGKDESPPLVPPYVALSYVWGQGNQGGQGGQNIETQKLAQDPQSAVIHDAIVMTLALGYGHLWVDQYCVVQQGDPAVKRAQLRAMDLVYANAEVTLVAAAGKGATAGLPGSPGRPRTGWPCVRVRGHALTVIPPHPAHHARSSSTWWTRGWTYQEGLMARRRLFFSDCEMSFECGMGHTRREAVHQPLHTDYDSSIHLRPQMFGRDWRLFSILEEYTARRLTYPADALNAILGIFRAYSQRKKSDLHHLRGVPVVPVGEKSNGSDDDGYGDLGVNLFTSGASKNGKDNHESDSSRWDNHPLDTVSIAAIIITDNNAWDPWKDIQQTANYRVGSVAGLVHGLFWRLKLPACRRPGFPSWSWTGWTGTVKRSRGRYSINDKDLTRIWIVPADVSISVVIPAQAQSGTAAATVPWTDFYNGLVAGTDEKYLLQHYVLAITAPVVSVRIREKSTQHDHSYYPSPYAFIGTVAFGNSIWEGGFFSTREDAYPPENKPGTTPGFRKRLLSEPWLGIMLRLAPCQDQRMESTVLVVTRVQPADQVEGRWERIGVLMLRCSLAGHTLERRTIYLS